MSPAVSCTQQPLVTGLDHIPLVVSDLDKAQADFRAMGFAIKPGRLHADGIRNAHVKFPEGTEIELITAPKAVDDLTSEYRAQMKMGEGPVYFGLFAADPAAVASRLQVNHVNLQHNDGISFPADTPLHPLFFGRRNKSPTDRPEHFAHSNSAIRLSALFVRDTPQLRAVLQDLGVPLSPTSPCGDAEVGKGVRASLSEGDLVLVPSTVNVTAARVEVRALSAVEAVLKTHGVPARKDPACGTGALWIPPSSAHGIWIEFAEPPKK